MLLIINHYPSDDDDDDDDDNDFDDEHQKSSQLERFLKKGKSLEFNVIRDECALLVHSE